MVQYPKWKFVIMGLCDALGYVLGIFAARKITGYLLTLLPQVLFSSLSLSLSLITK
jgi:hypothetical protein